MFADLHRKLIRRTTLPAGLTSARVRVGQSSFKTPKVETYMCELGEPWIVDLLDRIMPERRGTFVDVGVNLGQTLLAVKAVEPGRHYVGVEPNPLCVAYVERLKEMNHLQNCLVVPVGIGREAGIKRLQLYHGHSIDSSASLVENFRPAEPVRHVVLVPVFAYGQIAEAAGLDELGFVKIDVEGAESEVLFSMRDALRQSKPWLIVEVLPCYNTGNVDRIRRQTEIEQLLQELDYAMFRIEKQQNGKLDQLKKVAKFGIHGNLAWSDYLFCPASDLDRLRGVVPLSSD